VKLLEYSKNISSFRPLPAMSFPAPLFNQQFASRASGSTDSPSATSSRLRWKQTTSWSRIVTEGKKKFISKSDWRTSQVLVSLVRFNKISIVYFLKVVQTYLVQTEEEMLLESEKFAFVAVKPRFGNTEVTFGDTWIIFIERVGMLKTKATSHIN